MISRRCAATVGAWLFVACTHGPATGGRRGEPPHARIAATPITRLAEPGAMLAEEPPPDCWRRHWPVVACARAEHPELVGLWGRWTGPRFESAFLYDGCHVAGLRDEMSAFDPVGDCAATYGVAGLGLRGAHLSVAAWACDVLIPYSLAGVPPVGRRVAGGFVDVETGASLTRLDDLAALDRRGRDLLCVRVRAAMPSECRPPELDPAHDLPCWSPRTRRERIDRIDALSLETAPE